VAVTHLVRRIVSSLVVVAAFAGIVYACTEIETDDGTDDVATTGDSPVERLIPPRGSEILRQEPVGVDLRSGWTGVLQVNGVEIPEDEADAADLASTGVLTYTVGDDKTVERFEAGENCVTAVVWRVEDTRQDARSVSWCFNVT
jgi:hypothetical protein